MNYLNEIIYCQYIFQDYSLSYEAQWQAALQEWNLFQNYWQALIQEFANSTNSKLMC